MRTAMVGSPPDTTLEIFFLFLKIIVSGPGQKVSISFCSSEEILSVNSDNCSMVAICTMIGLSEGRPLAIKIFRTASSLKTFAPNPYTVSVGKTTKPPDFMMLAARSRVLCLFSFVSLIVSVCMILSQRMEMRGNTNGGGDNDKIFYYVLPFKCGHHKPGPSFSG